MRSQRPGDRYGARSELLAGSGLDRCRAAPATGQQAHDTLPLSGLSDKCRPEVHRRVQGPERRVSEAAPEAGDRLRRARLSGRGRRGHRADELPRRLWRRLGDDVAAWEVARPLAVGWAGPLRRSRRWCRRWREDCASPFDPLVTVRIRPRTTTSPTTTAEAMKPGCVHGLRSCSPVSALPLLIMREGLPAAGSLESAATSAGDAARGDEPDAGRRSSASGLLAVAGTPARTPTRRPRRTRWRSTPDAA